MYIEDIILHLAGVWKAKHLSCIPMEQKSSLYACFQLCDILERHTEMVLDKQSLLKDGEIRFGSGSACT